MFLVTKQMCEEAPNEMIFFPTGSLRMRHDTAVHDEHQLILQREEVWNHQLQVWLTVINVKCVRYGFQIQYFPDVGHHIRRRFFVNRRDKASVKEGKERHKNRTSRKPATERGANNSSHQPAQTEHPLVSSEENQLPVGQRGPTIPRNTGQRYSALLPSQGAEQKHHITFSSPN